MQPPKLAEFMMFARGALTVGAFAGESRMRATTGHIRSSVQGIVSRKVRAWCEPVITPESLQAKLVTARRGGYCFEHASLMYAVLEAIGFQAVRHASRVLLHEPRHESVRQHMFLTVAIGDETYVVDPGFGPFGCSEPIPMTGAKAPCGNPTHRLVREGNDWILHVTRDGEEIQGWVSMMEVEYPVDFEMMNHYIATHPASFFTHNILASAPTDEGRVNIMNQDATIIRNGVVESAHLEDRKALRTLVAKHFGFDLPELEAMRVDAVPGWQ